MTPRKCAGSHGHRPHPERNPATLPAANPAAARSTDLIGEETVVDARALAAAIAEPLAQTGHAVYDDDYADRQFIYRTGAEPAHLTLRALQENVREAALQILTAAEDTEDRAAARRAATTRRLIEQRAPGVKSYLLRVAHQVRDALPLIGTEEHETITAALASRRPAPKPAKDRSAYYAARRVALAEQNRGEALEVLRKWLPTLAPGRHEIAEVWAAWQTAVAGSARVAHKYPGATKIGRTIFYELLDDAATVVSGRSRRRYVVIPGV